MTRGRRKCATLNEFLNYLLRTSVKVFRFHSDFLLFALFQEVTTEITIHYKCKEKNKTTNYINHQR